MGNKTLISIVIVAAPGRRRDLLRCLRSIVASSYKQMETIVVDNSNDSSMAKAITRQFPTTRIIRMPENTGIFGFNVGYANAQGEYILSLDDDSAVRPDTLAQIDQRLQKEPKKTGILSLNRFNPINSSYYLESSVPQKKGEYRGFSSGACAFRKEIFLEIGYYDRDFFCWIHEDDFVLRALNAGFNLVFAQDIVIDHYEQSSGLRQKLLFFSARNKVWLNIKHFSLRFLLLLVARDLIWLILLPYRRKSIKAIYYGLKGYLSGIITAGTALGKRQVVAEKIQKMFLRHYLLSDLVRVLKI